MGKLLTSKMEDQIRKRKTELKNLRMGPGGQQYMIKHGTVRSQIEREFGIKYVKVTGADRVAAAYGGRVKDDVREAINLQEHRSKTGRLSLPKKYANQKRGR